MDIRLFKTNVLPVRGKLYHVAMKILGNEHDAEDVVQESMLKLWLMRQHLSGYKSIEAYAVQMTKNISLNKIRARKPVTENWFDDVPETARKPDQQAEEKDSVEMVSRIIENLPDMQKMIIQLRDIEGYQPEEIAEITGCEIATVRVNLSRARKKVKEIFFRINKFDK
jgi:RNA polymerase sigma-70 factor (ECF subfamily)